jgi:hypothetical protein
VQQVLQLAHIAREGMVRQQRQRLRRQPRRRCHAGIPGDAGEDQVADAAAGRRCVRAGRHAHLDDVEPVVQVLPEAALLHLGGQVLVGGADDAHVHRQLGGGAHLAHGRSWMARSSLLCIASGRSPISSRNSVPPCAAWKKPSGLRWRR